MKTKLMTILLTASVLLVTVALPSLAADANTSDIWQDERPRRGWQLTDERIEQIMKRLAEADPEKAEQLEKLREENPEQFRAELRKTITDRFGQRSGRRGDGRRGSQGDMRREGRHQSGPEPGMGGEGEQHQRFGPRGGGKGGPEDEHGKQMRMRQEHHEFIEWLKQNYPDEAEKIEKLRDEKPELHDRRRGMALRTYREIFEASKSNSALAEILKEDMTLRRQRFKLIRQIRSSEDEDQKTALKVELETVVGQRYDLLIKRKQLEFENLLKKLEKLKAEIEKKEADVARWQQPDFKAKSIKDRIEELTSSKRRFRWD